MLPDAVGRARIAEDLGSSLVVVAGAGTGKTTALVGRVVELIRNGAGLRELAVITFTETAAAELRSRLRLALEEAVAQASDGSPLATARTQVDEATVCTLHAFAQRMLVEHGVAVGVPPGFDVLDQVAEQADLEARFASFTDALFDDPGAESVLLRGFMLGLGPGDLLDVATCLHRHWDRLEGDALALIDAQRPGPGPLARCDVGRVVRALDEAIGLNHYCTDDSDLLLAHLQGRLNHIRALLLAAGDDEHAVLALLLRAPSFACSLGRGGNWGERAGEVRAACGAAEEIRQEFLADVRAPVVAELTARVAHFTLDSAADRAAEGRLTFHDLLVLGRRLLRHDPEARQALRSRYRHLLIDEFQDTDPIQVELAAWLASAAESAELLSGARPGALFVVGDPKQSIYRFRRADIALFERVCSEVGEQVVMASNFRSVPGILDFVNRCFEKLFVDGSGVGQAEHFPLSAVRRPLPGLARPGADIQLQLDGLGSDQDEAPPEPAAVVVLGGPMAATVGEARRAAAAHGAIAIRRAVGERWPVSDPTRPSAPLRPLRWADVAVLIPTRTSLPPIEEAFDLAGVPYRLEGAALLWGSDDVRDVLCVLEAADEPSDSVAVLAALRSPGLACGDDDLVRWHGAGGSWDPRAQTPAGLEDGPVGQAMGILTQLHQRRWWAEPSEMVRLAMDVLGSFQLAFAHRRARDHWQRLRWLADQARLFDETSGGSLHEFLRWAELQRQGDGRASTLGPPDADDDAVRVMTIHGAKGLEFPMVVVAGLEREDGAGARPDVVLWKADGSPEVRIGSQLRSRGYDAEAIEDRALDRLERIRLLYVAMTRARDHLVLCLHHKQRTGGSTAAPSHAELLVDLCRHHPLLWRRLDDDDEPEVEPDGPPPPALAVRLDTPANHGGVDLPDPHDRADWWRHQLQTWKSRRSAMLQGAKSFPLVTATALQDEGYDVARDDPGWREPTGVVPRSAEAALSVGRAVHGALAALDFSTGLDVEGVDAAEVARIRATSHGVAEHAGSVAAMVSGAFTSDVIGRAATRRHHKEMFVAADIGGIVLEGFVDLLVEDDDGLVVVDYKTDHLMSPAALDQAVGRYTHQVAAYALALEAATGRPVVRCILLFLGPDRPLEHVLEGPALEAAQIEARQLASELSSETAWAWAWA